MTFLAAGQGAKAVDALEIAVNDNNTGGNKPNLIIEDVNYSVENMVIEGKEYTSIDFEVAYKNSGDADIAEPFYISLNSGPTEDYPDDYGYVGSAIINASESGVLKAGEGGKVVIGSYLLSRDKNLNEEFSIYADRHFPFGDAKDDLVDESDESHNFFYKRVIIDDNSAGGPDILTDEVMVVADYNINQISSIEETSFEIGKHYIFSHHYNVYSGSVDLFYGTFKIVNLDTNEIVTSQEGRTDGGQFGAIATYEWTPKQDGNYRMDFVLDSKNQIAESNEDNNTLSKTITVGNDSENSKVVIVAPAGGEKYKSGDSIKIKWQGGKERVDLEIVGKNSGATADGFNSDGIAGVIKANAAPGGEYAWNDRKVCSGDGSDCRIVPAGSYRILAVSKSANGNMIYGNDGPGGDTANWTLSDPFYIVDLSDTTSGADPQITGIVNKAKMLAGDQMDAIRGELNQLRDKVKEQQNEIKYLKSLKEDVKNLTDKVKDVINQFITYGVDANTEKLGAGERAAVINSFKAAFGKLPETEAELTDAIKIANGRFPSVTSDTAEKAAKDLFVKIYKRVADMNNANDAAAIKVMAYGLRQKAENRNLNSERAGIKIFKGIFGKVPAATEEWNAMQAITYSGATQKSDTDKDLVSDEMEKKIGTDPNKIDTDGDGFKDGDEVLSGYNPKGSGKAE
jgi:hypothetical protein